MNFMGTKVEARSRWSFTKFFKRVTLFTHSATYSPSFYSVPNM